MTKDTLISQIRTSSREMVRELGLLNNRFAAIGSTSLCHALVELDSHGVLNSNQLATILNLEKSTVSRLVMQMQEKELCDIQADPNDRRNKLISLTKNGQALANEIHVAAKSQVSQALQMMSAEEKNMVVQGIAIYAKALRKSGIQSEHSIRKLQKQDIPQLTNIIKSVWAEFKFDASHPEASLIEDELTNLYANYTGKNQEYYVLTQGEKIVGGAGFAGILTPEKKLCELKGMYLSQQLRGAGLGSMLLQKVLSEATARGYKQCYLETNDFMHGANKLYMKNGFEKLTRPIEGAGHPCTNIWYIKKL